MFELFSKIVTEAKYLLTNAHGEDMVIVATLSVVVLAVLAAMLQALYLLARSIHDQLAESEDFVLPMLVNSPARLLVVGAFSLLLFLGLLAEITEWLTSLWSGGG